MNQRVFTLNLYDCCLKESVNETQTIWSNSIFKIRNVRFEHQTLHDFFELAFNVTVMQWMTWLPEERSSSVQISGGILTS